MTALGCRSRSVRAVVVTVSATVSATVLAVVVMVAAPGRPAGAAPLATDQRAERAGERESQPRAACTGDVFRLCGTEAPRVDQIIACLRKSRSVLSPACKAVVDPKG